MDIKYELPFFVEIQWVFAVFFIFLILFHWILVFRLKLGKIAWKKVDYIWLGVGAIGLMASTSTPRGIIIDNLIHRAEMQISGELQLLHSVETSNTNSSVCIKFVHSPNSPAEPYFSETQRQYDATCNWLRRAKAIIPKQLDRFSESIEHISLPSAPKVSEQYLNQLMKNIRNNIDNITTLQAKIYELKSSKEKNPLEEIFQFLGPILISIATALRITKVTGEICCEDKNHVNS